jgi:non-reducing end alpha-L-arabinofuranosidase
MKKFRSVLILSALVSLGAIPTSCGSYPPAPGSNASGGTTGNSESGGSAGTTQCDTSVTGNLPCDVLERACHRCVSAHSTVRLLRSAYHGPLYQVQRADNQTKDIEVVDGYADATAHTAFCAGSICTVPIIYDQSTQKNDLTPSPPGSNKATPGLPAKASDLKVTINGHTVYGLKFQPGQGYRKLVGNGIAKGDEPEVMYMVSSQKDLKNGCCFDYGNAETTATNDGSGTMEAVYLGMGVVWGTGSGTGPWVMADLEDGLYPGWENNQDRNISTNTSVTYDFVTGVVVGDTSDKNGGKGRFAIYAGDATSGTLKTMYDGIRPEKNGYVPMRKQGSIILSIGGDNSDGDGGRFYEGAMANGAATKETVDALQAAIVAAGYGK